MGHHVPTLGVIVGMAPAWMNEDCIMTIEKLTPKRDTALRCEIVGTVLTITFADARILTVDASQLSQEIREHAMMHGLKQKLADAAAISRDPETGRTATIDTKYNAVATVHNRLVNDGQWNASRGEGGGAGGLLYRALIRFYAGTRTPEQIREYLDALNPAQQAALRVNARVAPIIAAIRDEDDRARGGAIDSDELLAGLE